MGVGEAGVEGVLDLASAAEHHPPATEAKVAARRRPPMDRTAASVGFSVKGIDRSHYGPRKAQTYNPVFFFFLSRYDWYLEHVHS